MQMNDNFQIGCRSDGPSTGLNCIGNGGRARTQNTMTFRIAWPDREEASASLIRPSG